MLTVNPELIRLSHSEGNSTSSLADTSSLVAVGIWPHVLLIAPRLFPRTIMLLSMLYNLTETLFTVARWPVISSTLCVDQTRNCKHMTAFLLFSGLKPVVYPREMLEKRYVNLRCSGDPAKIPANCFQKQTQSTGPKVAG